MFVYPHLAHKCCSRQNTPPTRQEYIISGSSCSGGMGAVRSGGDCGFPPSIKSSYDALVGPDSYVNQLGDAVEEVNGGQHRRHSGKEAMRDGQHGSRVLEIDTAMGGDVRGHFAEAERWHK